MQSGWPIGKEFDYREDEADRSFSVVQFDVLWSFPGSGTGYAVLQGGRQSGRSRGSQRCCYDTTAPLRPARGAVRKGGGCQRQQSGRPERCDLRSGLFV